MKFMHLTNTIKHSHSWKAKTGIYTSEFICFYLCNPNYELYSVFVALFVSFAKLLKKFSTSCGTQRSKSMFTIAQKWLLFTSIIQGGLLTRKPKQMASLMAIFPKIIFKMHAVTYHMLEQVLEMTILDSLTCLTPGQLLNTLKFLLQKSMILHN